MGHGVGRAPARSARPPRLLDALRDAFDKKIVGWSIGEHATTELVVNAVQMAITNRQPVIAPVHHSDRGTQYTSIAFSDRLAQLGLTPSMGSRGDAFDKAWASYCTPL